MCNVRKNYSLRGVKKGSMSLKKEGKFCFNYESSRFRDCQNEKEIVVGKAVNWLYVLVGSLEVN